VDVRDLGALGTHWQQTRVGWAQGDFNGDGQVDVVDLGVLGTNWQKTLPAGAPTAGSFPAAAPVVADAAPAASDTQTTASETVSQASALPTDGSSADSASIVSAVPQDSGSSVSESETVALAAAIPEPAATLPLPTVAPATPGPAAAASELPASQASAVASTSGGDATSVVVPLSTDTVVASACDVPQDSATTASSASIPTLPATPIVPDVTVVQGASQALPEVVVSTPPVAAPVRIEQAATVQAAESSPSVQDVGQSTSDLIALPLATSMPVVSNAVPVAVASSTSQEVRSGLSNSVVLYAVAQLDVGEQQCLSQTVNPMGLSSLAPAASTTLSDSAIVIASPKAQPTASLSVQDGALLWMAEQLDASKTTEGGIGSLAHEHWSTLTSDVTTSVFSDADDWMADVDIALT